jgi:hypothetical protein
MRKDANEHSACNPLLSGDDIWAMRVELQKLIDRADGDTKRVLLLAAEAMATAGTMEDRKATIERDRQDRKREANESFRQWSQDKGQFP